MTGRDEFYVGYLPSAPPGLGRRTRRLVLALLAAAGCVALLLTALQREYGPGVFEFGNVREFEGRVELLPHPVLLAARVDSSAGGGPPTLYLLTAPGKFGAAELLASWSGQPVRLRGTLAHREGRAMIEVVPGSVEPLPGFAGAIDEPVPLGPVTLAGEIVDSKCYLGVMNPGEAKPHRGCAVRCLSGGIPPLFVARDESGEPGRAARMLLVGRDGRALNREILDYVAEPVTIAGELSRRGDLLILAAEPRDIRRAGG